MAYAPTAAAQAFADAEQELKAAIHKFDMARAQYAKEGGKHMAMDERLIKSFNQLSAGAGQAPASQALAQF